MTSFSVPIRLVLVAMLFLPCVARGQCPDGAPPPCSPRAPAAAPGSVAVLYFDNLSRDTSDAYLADGLTEELISRLSQVDRLQVKSRTAVQRLRGRQDDPAVMGRSLGVGHLVSGSVLRASNRLRVNVELTRASSGVSVWSRTFERRADDLLAVEAEIAESVAVGVSGRLAPAERRQIESRPTRSAAAYDLYLRGNFELARRTVPALLRARDDYEAAIRLDPRFRAAMTRLAFVYFGLSGVYYGPDIGMSRDTILALFKNMSDRAIRLDSMSADAWQTLALSDVYTTAQRITAYDRAEALDPRNAENHHQHAVFLRDAGRDSLAVVQFQRALVLEPGRAISLLNLGQVYSGQGRYAEAARWVDSAVGFRPEAAFYYMEQGLVRMGLGDTAGVRAAAEQVAGHGNADGRDELLAMLEARAGDSAAARARLTRVDQAMRTTDCWLSHACLELSMALAGVGLRDDALAVFERIAPRAIWLAYWGQRPEFAPIRREPRYQAVMAEAQRMAR